MGLTFKGAMIKQMVTNGMFQSQAETVINEYIESTEANPMMDRWDEDVSGYPENLQPILWMGVKDYAAKWIAKNAPEAWFRPMFELSHSELQEMVKKSKVQS